MKALDIFLLTISSVMLQAQDQAKQGYFFGGAIGLSQLSLESETYQSGNQTGLSFPNFKIGKMVSSNKALLLYLPGSLYTFDIQERDRQRGFEAILPSVQYWFSDKAWLLASAGIAMDAPAFFDIKDETERKFYFGFGTATAIGYEVLSFGSKTVDIQGRVHYGNINIEEDNLSGVAYSILIGFNWY